MKPSRKWKRMAEIYQRFAEPWAHICDFSEESKREMYEYESTGKGNLSIGIFNQGKLNGYAVGKHWMDATVGMWKEDLGKTLFKDELYSDWFPHWWLDKVL